VCSGAVQRRMSKSNSGERPLDKHHSSTVLTACNLLIKSHDHTEHTNPRHFRHVRPLFLFHYLQAPILEPRLCMKFRLDFLCIPLYSTLRSSRKSLVCKLSCYLTPNNASQYLSFTSTKVKNQYQNKSCLFCVSNETHKHTGRGTATLMSRHAICRS
jgi:hypothetical protein